MTYRLPANSLRGAIRHLRRYGDTDVFPHLPEIAFLRERESQVVDELESLDLDSYSPAGAVDALAPKSRYAFRIVHQMPMLDTLLLLAAVLEVGPLIEKHRLSPAGIEVFSYRFRLGRDGRIFRNDRTYKHWLKAQQTAIKRDRKIRQIVATDISDFYARINFHRLENLLDEATGGHPACRYIKKHIKIIRAKQSFGLPVGGSAARLLAELSISDTDRSLKNEGCQTTRFVDDFRFFLRKEGNFYDAIAVLAEQLSVNEGLSLNGAKTRVYPRANYVSHLRALLTDVSERAAGQALDSLVADLYFGDEPDPAELAKLKRMNLLKFLQKEVGKADSDMGRIRVIFRALKIAKPEEAIEYLSEKFLDLVVFAKELALLMQALEEENPGCFDDLTETVLDAIVSPPASSVQLIRTWLLELFTRGTVPVTALELKKLNSLSSPLDQRQLFLIRGRTGDKNYFRRRKVQFGQLSPFSQTHFIWGASCLPRDEYKAWLQLVKPMYSAPTGQLFLKWAETEQFVLMDKLKEAGEDHVE